MERLRKAGIAAKSRMETHLDAASAWAAFETLVLDARTEVTARLARFDAQAPLSTARARSFATTWGDLIAHSIARGIDVRLALNAPDGPDALEDGFAAIRAAVEAAPNICSRRGTLDLLAATHPGAAPGLFPAQRRMSVDHHLNLALVDDKAIFVTRAGLVADDIIARRRDLSVIARGPVVAEGRSLIAGLDDFCAGLTDPPPVRRLVRTIARPQRTFGRMRDAQTVVNEIENAHNMLIRRAEHLIYVETQSFDCEDLARHFANRAQTVPGLEMVLVLPEAARACPLMRKCLTALRQGFGDRLFVGIAPGGCVNASIFDDDFAIAGSADLGTAALRRNSEASLYLRRGEGVDALRARLMGAWRAHPEADLSRVAAWRAQSTLSPYFTD